MKEYKTIGFFMPSEVNDFFRLDSFSSLADTDIAVFCPNLETTKYSTYDISFSSSGVHEGKKLYNKESSSLIIQHINHWRKELLHFIETGGTLFVVLPKMTNFFIYTGEKKQGGIGKNQKTISLVTPCSNYNFLPFDFLEFNIASGEHVYPKSDIVKDFSYQFNDLLSYEVYIKSKHDVKPIFITRKGDRILGNTFKISNGFVVLLPNIDFDKKEFYTQDKKSGVNNFNEEAIRRGKIFINTLVSIETSLRNKKENTPKPIWVDDEEFAIASASITKIRINKVESEIENKKNELTELKSTLEDQESLKNLLFETGKQLELAVIKALRILGYTAEKYDDGQLELDQIILSPEGYRYIGECEGKDNKDIDVSKFRQLLDGLNADFEKPTVSERANGILFGNSQRLLSPNERNLDFTLKCRTGAKRENIALIKTSDLFRVCKNVQDGGGEEYAKLCRESIHNQLGEIVIFPNYKSEK